MSDFATSVYAAFFGSSILIAPEYLFVFILVAYGIFRARRHRSGFWGWLLPRDIYRHASTRTDVKLFVLGRVLAILGLFNKIALTSVVALGVANTFGVDQAKGVANPWLVAALLLLATDFIFYWLHRIYHTTPVFWPIHAVHHSAEVLSPITAYRQHPLADVLGVLIQGLAVGLVQGLVLVALGVDPTMAEVAGVNAFFFLFAMLTANFRHSHIWISFGPLWEHILISPAQHQVHHSIAPQHRNRNFGENLAIWDWMFGSLYITRGQETLALGLDDGAGNVVQPYPTLWAALVMPIVEIWRVLTRRDTTNAPDKSDLSPD